MTHCYAPDKPMVSLFTRHLGVLSWMAIRLNIVKSQATARTTAYLTTVFLQCRLAVSAQTLSLPRALSPAARHAGIKHTGSPIRPLPADFEEVDAEIPQLRLDHMGTLDAAAQCWTTQHHAVSLRLRWFVAALYRM